MSLVADSLGGRIASSASFPELQTLLERIKRACDPVNVILYGSRARHEASAQSDWDLKIIVSDDAPDTMFSPMFGWRLQEGSGVYADLSFVRVSEFHADLAVANSSASHIAHDGVVVDVC